MRRAIIVGLLPPQPSAAPAIMPVLAPIVPWKMLANAESRSAVYASPWPNGAAMASVVAKAARVQTH